MVRCRERKVKWLIFNHWPRGVCSMEEEGNRGQSFGPLKLKPRLTQEAKVHLPKIYISRVRKGARYEKQAREKEEEGGGRRNINGEAKRVPGKRRLSHDRIFSLVLS